MKYKVTLANLVNENRHTTIHKDKETADQYVNNVKDFYRIDSDCITIEAIEDGEGDSNGRTSPD